MLLGSLGVAKPTLTRVRIRGREQAHIENNAVDRRLAGRSLSVLPRQHQTGRAIGRRTRWPVTIHPANFSHGV
jgi:hypothetical protein